MYYRWIVIENSLNDKSILDMYQKLSQTDFEKNNPMYKIRVPEEEVLKFSADLKNKIIHPYYSHFYHEDPRKGNLIVVFANKRFLASKDTYKLAMDYGVSHEVSVEAMQIEPTDVSEERW